MTYPNFTYEHTIPLRHRGDVNLIGLSDDQLYVEEIYGDDFWLAQHIVSLDGALITSVDEQGGAQTELEPLPLPDNLVRPATVWHTMMLNFAGARHRGLRSLDRVDDLVHPLTMHEKIAVVERLGLNVLPPAVIGLAESYVVGEAALVHPHVFLVCRRLRIAYLLPEEQTDTDGQPYNYDTIVFYSAHLYDRAAEGDPPLLDESMQLPGVVPQRPMDCLLRLPHLFIADGGTPERESAVHVWRVDGVQGPPTIEQQLNKRLYGS